MQSAVTEDSESDGAGGNRERLALLPKAGGGHQQAEVIPINYGSDGEASPEKRVAAEDVREGGISRERSRGTSAQGDEEEEEEEGEGGTQQNNDNEATTQRNSGEDDSDTKCGLLYCGKKLLNLLPSIGDGEEEGTKEFEDALRYGAGQVVQLIIPVSICMIVVLIFQLTIAVNETGPQQQLYYLPLKETSSSSGINFLFGLVNALVFVALVIVMTTVLVCLFKYRCYKAIYVWLALASGILLFVVSSVYFIEIMQIRQLVIDWFTFVFIIWNFGLMGLMVIHWKGPLRLQQGYLILTSALVATVLIKYLPEWTTWVILAAISIYDLFAVLCPKGPLRILVETAKERGEPIFPSLIYSSTMVWVIGMGDKDDKKSPNNRGAMPMGRPQSTSPGGDSDEDAEAEIDGESDAQIARRLAAREMAQQQEEREEEEEEPRGFKLGLGDFIFYSVLVGKAAKISNGDWTIISSCFVAILIGLCMTSLILGIVRRALPALPISIFFGLVFYFASQYLISPYVEVLAINQVFI